MSYLFFAGAPGSKWSSVIKNIYWSDSFDHSDYSDSRQYWHDAECPGNPELLHIGAYWDPGMEFGENWDFFELLSDQEIFEEFKKPFSDQGIKLIKSHIFCNNLDRLSIYNYPIVLVYRNDIECLKWWEKCGEFNITYPTYNYYRNLKCMWNHIKEQNANIQNFIYKNYNNITRVYNNKELLNLLGLLEPDDFIFHNYIEKDIQVYVYKN